MYEPKLPLLLEEDMLIFSPWDALNYPEASPQESKLVRFRANAATGVTFRIYGTRGISDLTGKPTIEDMEVWWGDIDVTNQIPESLMQEWSDKALEEIES